MRTIRQISLPLIFYASLCGLQAQPADSLLREARYWQDQRSLGSGRLMILMNDVKPAVRSAALVAAANIGDTTAGTAIASHLSDLTPEVRAAAAFALGMIPDVHPQRVLLARLQTEKDHAVVTEVLSALGKCGSAEDLDSLFSAFGSKWSSSHRGALVLAAMRFGIRGIRTDRALWYCWDALEDRSMEVRWRSLYALWRMGAHPLQTTELAKHLAIVERLVRDPAPDVRSNLATLLGRIDSPESRSLLLTLASSEERRSEPDGRVGVQIARALAIHGRSSGASARAFLRILESKDPNVLAAAFQALQSGPALVSEGGIRDTLRDLLTKLALDPRLPASVSGDAAVALLRTSPSSAPVVLERFEKPGTPVRWRAKALEAFSQAPTRQHYQGTRAMLLDPSMPLAMAAWDFLRRYFRPANIVSVAPDESGRIAEVRGVVDALCRALGRHDMGLTTVVSSLASDSDFVALIDKAGLRPMVVDSMVVAFGWLHSPADVETMQAAAGALGALGDRRAVPLLEGSLNDPDRTVGMAAAEALKKITGEDRSALVPASTKPLHSDYDWNELRTLSSHRFVTVVTNRGTFMLELRPQDAPFTALSFVRLARKKFYDGLTFHRVVPNFVVQGGDPRGDGWGGPGYALRTEVSESIYQRGSVGVASAGKDTEGCQFFITHSPTPHLDGRYTIFAQVIKGMYVVDRLQVGDSILSVRLN